jgi:hypothetical protein
MAGKGWKFSGFLERFADEKVRLDGRNVALQGGFLSSVLEKENFDLSVCLGYSWISLDEKTSLEVWKITNEFSLKFVNIIPAELPKKPLPKISSNFFPK